MDDLISPGRFKIEDSVTYQIIFDEGFVIGYRRSLRKYALIELGKPSATESDAFEAIADLKRLEKMFDRVFKVATWAEFLAESNSPNRTP
ncbi:MAG TPA: hypothetical protein VFE47_29940 [Tepidisphaeraceae bacterium]|jgi:hypothetical protein|nr:hypothetical protein [Tepidisphaeraceae bacterium]